MNGMPWKQRSARRKIKACTPLRHSMRKSKELGCRKPPVLFHLWGKRDGFVFQSAAQHFLHCSASGHRSGGNKSEVSANGKYIFLVDGNAAARAGSLALARQRLRCHSTISGTRSANSAIFGAAIGGAGSDWNSSFFISRFLTRPLKHLEAASHAISEGKRGVRVKNVSDDELKHLGDAFNEMDCAL